MARGPQKTTRLVRGGPLVTIILSNRTITTHNNGQYKTHYRYSRKSKTFVLNDCNVKNEVTEFGKEFQILGPWNKIENCLVLVRQAWERKCEELLVWRHLGSKARSVYWNEQIKQELTRPFSYWVNQPWVICLGVWFLAGEPYFHMVAYIPTWD